MMKKRPTQTIKSVDDTEIEYWDLPEEIEEIHEKLADEAAEKMDLSKFPLRPSAANKLELDLYMELENQEAVLKGTNPLEGNAPLYKPEKLDGRVLSLLQLGHTIEPQVIDHVSKLYKIEHRNKKVKYGELKRLDGSIIELWGELDMGMLDEHTGRRIIGDSKTSGRFAFNLTPKAEHFAQINLYLHSEEMKAEGYTHGRIYYYNKDNSEMKANGFAYSQKLAQAVLDKFQRVLTAFEKGERPPQTAFWGGDDWRADYSSFRTYLHHRFGLPLDARESIKDGDLFKELEAELKSKRQKAAINPIAQKIDNKVVYSKDGRKKLYLLLTNKGLVVIIEDNDGFSTLK